MTTDPLVYPGTHADVVRALLLSRPRPLTAIRWLNNRPAISAEYIAAVQAIPCAPELRGTR